MPRRPHDVRPEIEVLGAEPAGVTPDTVQVVGQRRRRWRTPLLAASVLLAVVVLVVGTDPEADPVPDPSPEADRRDAAAPLATPTTAPIGRLPVVDGAVPTTVLVRAGSRWTATSLADGTSRRVLLPTGMTSRAVPVTGGLVLQGPGGTAVFHRLDPEVAPTELGAADQVLAAHRAGGASDAVWLIDRSGPPVGRLVGVDGAVRETVGLPAGVVLGGTEGGLVVVAGGRASLVSAEGSQPLGAGAPLLMDAGSLLVRTCEASGRCQAEVRTATGDEGVRLDALTPLVDEVVARDAAVALAVRSDGAVAVTTLADASAVPRVRLFDASGGRTGGADLGPSPGVPAWLPGDLGLLALDEGAVLRIHRPSGAWVVERLPIEAGGPIEEIYVISG